MNRKQQKQKKVVQSQLLMDFFKKNPNRNIKHPEVVDWAVAEYKRKTGKVFRDPDRGIRKLHQEGFLIKVKKGIYCYDSKLAKQKDLKNFSPALKRKIFARDNFRCVVCGLGPKDGVELHADHIKPKDLGGKVALANGQTLCSKHNFLKKNFRQTETGKRLFIRLYKLAKKEKNKKLINFCKDILKIFEKHNINGHIKWQQ
jgi:predicted restriction endonuclease